MAKDIKTSDYWINREIDQLRIEQKADDEVIAEVKKILINAMTTAEVELNNYYARYASREGISLADAKKRVDNFDIDRYKQFAKQYVEDKDFSYLANKRLALYNTAMYVNREKYIKSLINLHLIKATSDVEYVVDDYLNDATIREMKHNAGMLGNMEIKRSRIHAVVNSSHYNATWSERLWQNMDEVRHVVDQAVNEVMLRGRHPAEYTQKLKALTGRSEYEVNRLLITEVSRVQTEAKRISYEEKNVLRYKYLAVLDGRTTHTCRSLNGKKFDVKDMTIGVNAPPMHPFCRSRVLPTKSRGKRDYDKDDIDEGTLTIIEDEVTKEADEENDAVLKEIEALQKRIDKLNIKRTPAIKTSVTGNNDLEKHIENKTTTELGSKVTEMLTAEQIELANLQLNKGREQEKTLLNRHGNVETKVHGNAREGSYFHVNSITIHKQDISKGRDGWQREDEYAVTLFHELGHAVDKFYMYDTMPKRDFTPAISALYKSEKHKKTLGEMVLEESETVLKSLQEEMGASSLRDLYRRNSKHKDMIDLMFSRYGKHNLTGVSDMLSAVSYDDTSLGMGHSNSYWTPRRTSLGKRIPIKKQRFARQAKVGSELFAHLFQASITSMKAYRTMAQLFPKSVEIYEELIAFMMTGEFYND